MGNSIPFPQSLCAFHLDPNLGPTKKKVNRRIAGSDQVVFGVYQVLRGVLAHTPPQPREVRTIAIMCRETEAVRELGIGRVPPTVSALGSAQSARVCWGTWKILYSLSFNLRTLAVKWGSVEMMRL